MDANLLKAYINRQLEIILLDETDSTNARAAEGFKSCRSTRDTLIIAKRQTAGRGRRGRQFFSPSGGIYMSLLIKNTLSAAESLLITPVAAVAVFRAVKKICRINCGIKWVNDLELGGKKVCGILCENLGGAIVIGIGLNFTSRTPFPPELAQTACCLYPSEPTASAEALAAEIVNQLCCMLEDLPRAYFLADYREQSTLLGKRVVVHTPAENYSATALAIDDECRLTVQTDVGQTVILSSGEVTVRAE